MATADPKSILHRRPGKANVLECGVCEDVFGLQGDKVPRLLLCGHTLCHDCLTRLPLHGRAIRCPFDRQMTEIGDSGVWGLKKNFALLELLERLQFGRESPGVLLCDVSMDTEKETTIRCDENEDHLATIYCTVCSTNLCAECAQSTHATRTLAKHKLVPLHEKPREKPMCPLHQTHAIEFVCLEDNCQCNPLMCYVCKDYGKHQGHKHTLIEHDAEQVRVSIIDTLQHVKGFLDEVSEGARRLGSVIQQMEGCSRTVENEHGFTHTEQLHGTAEEARVRVRRYFQDLHETLHRQENVALSVVDTHVREKLCSLKQQQEDMAVVVSQVTTICVECEKMLQQDDHKVLLAKQEIRSLLETVRKQQQQFTDLPEQLHMDPSIPLTFTKDNRVHIGPKMEMRVVTLGLNESGKTAILFKLKQDEFMQTIPTIGFNVETVEYKNLKFTIWDVGGKPKLRPLWKHYYLNTQALIFVVDSADCGRLDEAYDELSKLLAEKELREAVLLVFANKQDLPNALPIEEITEKLSLHKLCCGRSWHIQACDARTGMGLHDGLDWLSHQLVAAGVLDIS